MKQNKSHSSWGLEGGKTDRTAVLKAFVGTGLWFHEFRLSSNSRVSTLTEEIHHTCHMLPIFYTSQIELKTTITLREYVLKIMWQKASSSVLLKLFLLS